MSVGVMKDYKLKLRNLHASYTLGWSCKDKDEVNEIISFFFIILQIIINNKLRYLTNSADPVPLILDLRIVHDRFGSSSNPDFTHRIRKPLAY